MSADIHMYIEYRSKTPSPHANPTLKSAWSNFGSQYYVGRNYSLFGLLAGVRDDRQPAIVEPRGMPEDFGSETRDDYSLYICSSNPDDDGNVSPETAKSWVDSGYSEYLLNHEGKPWRVTGPDWHSHSWLTPDEYESALNAYAEVYEADPYGGSDPGLRFRVLLPLMRALEDDGKNEVRTVFWFDN